MLSACSNDIIAKPTDYDNPLVVNTGSDKLNSDVANNITSIIYDAMRDNGTLAKDVLDEILLQIAYSVYGTYEELKTEGATATSASDAFLENHKIYHVLDADGNRVTDKKAEEQRRVHDVLNEIEKRIAEDMYDQIAGSYQRDGYFYEQDFLYALKNKLEPVTFSVSDSALFHDKYLVIPELKKEDVFTYQWDAEDDPTDTKLPGLLTRSFYEEYITEKIIPEIYREKLVEVYLFEDSYNTLGRSYARKVNIVTITNRNTDLLGANNLMNTYIDTYINTSNQEVSALGDFEIISKAWRGLNTVENGVSNGNNQYSNASYLLKTSGQQWKTYDDAAQGGFTNNVFNYYTGTSYAQMVNDLSKVKKDPLLTDSTLENSFTNTGEYTVAQGVEFKENDIRKEDYTTDGWFLKNGGLTDLDSTLRAQLFNIGVANALDDETYPDRFVNGEYSVSEDEGRYIAKINGRYFLKTTTSQNEEVSGAKLKDILWFNKDSGTYTLVEVLEAVSSSKLSKTSTSNYATLYNQEHMDDIANDVAKEIAKNDSYKTLSTRYWLEAASIAYHDTVIYDYFVENYPELFEDA